MDIIKCICKLTKYIIIILCQNVKKIIPADLFIVPYYYLGESKI